MRKRREGPEGVLVLEALRMKRWTTSAGAVFAAGLCLMISARGVASAAQGRPEMLLLTVFGVVGCAIVIKHWAEVMAATGAIVIEPVPGSIRFTALPANVRSMLGKPGFAPVDVEFGAIEGVELQPDHKHFGDRHRVILKLKEPANTEISVDDDLDGSQAQALQRIIDGMLERSGSSGHGPAAVFPGPMPPSPRSEILLRHCFSALAAVGALAFLAGFLTTLIPIPALDSIELPLGAPEGLLEDDQRRIIVGSKSYLRLQRYLPDGSFDRSWRAPAVKGEWRLAVGSGGAVVLRSLPSGCWTVDEHGVSGPEACPEALLFGGPTKSGSLEIRSWPFRVMRGSEVVVSQSVLHNVLRSPLPAFALFVVGLAGSLLLQRRRRRGGPRTSRISGSSTDGRA